MGLLGSFALQSYRQRSPASKPWNKCDNFYESERIITIHSVFLSYFVSIFAGRAHRNFAHFTLVRMVFIVLTLFALQTKLSHKLQYGFMVNCITPVMQNCGNSAIPVSSFAAVKDTLYFLFFSFMFLFATLL